MAEFFEIYIGCDPDRLWSTLIDPHARGRFQFGANVHSTWTGGSSYRVTHPAFDSPLIAGVNLLVDRPRRLVQTFHARWNHDVARVAPSRVTWEITQVGGSCRLTLAHDELRPGSQDGIVAGWPVLLSSLKTWIETGRELDTPGAFGVNRARADIPLHSFTAVVNRGVNKGDSIHVVMTGSVAFFGTRRHVRVRGRIDDIPVKGSFVPLGDGTHKLALPPELRKKLGRDVGDHVTVQLDAWMPTTPGRGDPGTDLFS